ncbi:hypothetical protein ABZS88_39450 [Streptomyces sp. NPDC005480]|uniref:hypothetical protein n=1 Tax=Streptomyces sp. NPDC005480 TaxID=3154880 RepID=UPI0033AB3BEC
MGKVTKGIEKETVPGEATVTAATVAAPRSRTEATAGRGAALRVERAGISRAPSAVDAPEASSALPHRCCD